MTLFRLSMFLVPAILALLAQPALAGPVLVLGDSIGNALGVPPGQGWAALVDARLREGRYGCEVVNASVDGETTDGGLARLPALLEAHAPAVVIIELGGNDGLRGLPLDRIAANLDATVALAQDADAEVLVMGMVLPPNYGPRYTLAFAALFEDVATRTGAAYVPFPLLSAPDPTSLFQADGIHPTADAQARIADGVWDALEAVVGR